MCSYRNGISDQEYGKKGAGTQCDICTGCGRCAGIERKVSVLTQSDLELTWEREGTLENTGKRRLVTVDIGTTTIAMQLFGTDKSIQDEFVQINPQVEYGADVISRIQAADNAEAAGRMQESVREALCQGLKRFLGKIEPEESLFLVIAANTTMVYLLMGYDVAELGRAPFAASHLKTENIVINVEGVDVSGVILPGLSAFVGGDILSGIYACRMAEQNELTLLIDLGTNGELVLGNQEHIVACATAAGPAFEGGVNRGVWGSDMIRILAELRRKGILDETGLLADPYFDAGIQVSGVHVTQAAIRAVQLAKGAIHAGIHILAREYGVALKAIDRVVLAGGFGYYLDPKAAVVIGLLPRVLAERAVSGGNTALAGAAHVGEQILCQGYPEEFLEEFWKQKGCQVEIRNLAEQAEFNELFLQFMELQEI
ncbi:MAG: DUF4445 domain-containing protein [Acetatifactor sp.]|nr:DUF4445 domain-containing protein [Acetatifactor sp.]